MKLPELIAALAAPPSAEGATEYAAFDLRSGDDGETLDMFVDILAGDPAPEDRETVALLETLPIPQRLLGYRMLGYLSGGFELERRQSGCVYTATLELPRPGKLVFAFEASPPNQDQAFCVFALERWDG